MDSLVFNALQKRAGKMLAAIELESYYGFPSQIDVIIAVLGETLASATASQRAEFGGSLDAHGRRLLGRFTLRAPVLALRSGEPAVLQRGLEVYALLRQSVGDWRDDLVAFAPYHYVARKLGTDPVHLFDEVSKVAVPDLADVMQRFGRRSDVTLGAFGWRLVPGPTLEMLGMSGEPVGAVVGDSSWERVNNALVKDLMDWIARQRREPPYDG